jgi:hypothetical protein
MKLFQQMLVATASVGLIAPIAAQASDVLNIEGMNDYKSSSSSAKRFSSESFVNEVNEELATIKGRVDGLEARQNNFEAGSFSDTTTLDGKAYFTLGAVDYSLGTVTDSEATQAMYTYQMNLNTSFTGDDNLYVRIKSGNHSDWSVTKDYGTYLKSGNGNGDVLKVDKIWYEFPVGDRNTVWVGPKIENYYMHGTTPSIYQPITKQFTLGGNGEAYGASTDTGAGWAYKADNGFAVSTNIGTKSNSSCATGSNTTNAGCIKKTSSNSYVNTGLLTGETKTSWATQIGYTKPRYSASAIVNIKTNGWSDTYYHTSSHGGTGSTTKNFTSIGLRGWWRPEVTGTATPSVSLGFDTTEYDGNTSATSNSTAWFAGLNWQDMFQADDKIGLAFGQPTTNESETTDPFAYELYYAFKANDSVTITPAVFGGSDRNGSEGAGVFGALVETTFKF